MLLNEGRELRLPEIVRAALLLAIGLLLGCAATPSADERTGLRTRLALIPLPPDEQTATASSPIFATRAVVIADGRLQLSYLDSGREIRVAGDLAPARATDESVTDAQPAELVPPIVTFSPSPTAPAEPRPPTASPVVIRSLEDWQTLVRALEAEIVRQVPDRGVVLDVLRQQELFLYVNELGQLRAVPLEDKPRAIEPAGVVTLTELLQDGVDRIRRTLRRDSPNLRYLLFNTGDLPETGFPFVFVDLDAGRVFFFQRQAESRSEPATGATGATGAAQLAAHAITGQLRNLAGRPVSTLARLVSGVGSTAIDSVDLASSLAEPSTPIAPLAERPYMDPIGWERELDRLTGRATSFGRIRYLVDGEAFFPALIHAIKRARRSIRLRMYIFDNDDYALKIADLLKSRSLELPVKILVDGLGTLAGGIAEPAYRPGHAPRSPLSIVGYLRADSDIRVRTFANPWMQGDHTKVMIFDGETAFLGGMNIGREYRYEWHDLMVELTGPIVDLLAEDFEDAWIHAGVLGDLQAAFRRREPQSRAPADRDYPVRLLYTSPINAEILRTQLAALRRAQHRVWIQNAYLTSDAILHQLLRARRRGVDVRVILPYQTDSGLIDRSNVLAANRMLRHGIRVYIHPRMSHLKAAVFDGWACLGSANFDKLSLRLNNETNIATSHPPAVQGLVNEVFVADFAAALELTEPLPSNWLDYLKELIADQL